MKKKVLLIVASIYLMGSCTKETIETQESEIKTYSGEDLFRGIFLMEGEVAEKIPSYTRAVEEKKRIAASLEFDRDSATQAIFENDMINLINQMDSTYLEELSIEIASKDPYRVNQIIIEGSLLFSDALIELYNIYGDTAAYNSFNDLTEDIQDMDFDTDVQLIEYLRERFTNVESGDRAQCLVFYLGVVVYFGVVVDAAAAVNVAVAVDVYFAIALWGPQLDSPVGNGGSSDIGITTNHSLKRELFVRELCEMPLNN